MRKEFEMTPETYEAMLTKAGPVMLIGGVDTREFAQMDANSKWRKLGDDMGFVWDSARPSEKGKYFFTAEVKDNDK